MPRLAAFSPLRGVGEGAPFGRQQQELVALRGLFLLARQALRNFGPLAIALRVRHPHRLGPPPDK